MFGVLVLYVYFNELEEFEKVVCFNKLLGLLIILVDVFLLEKDILKIVEIVMIINEYKNIFFDFKMFV